MNKSQLHTNDTQRCSPMLIMMTDEEIEALSAKRSKGILRNVRIVADDKGFARIEIGSDTRLDITENDTGVSSRHVFLKAEPVKQPPILVISHQPSSGGQKAFECGTCVKRLHLTGESGMLAQ